MFFTIEDDRMKLAYNYSMCSSIITACYRPESLLSSSIPLNRGNKKV